MPLDEITRNRIARKILVHKLAQEKGIVNGSGLKREVPNAAKKMGEKPSDVVEFVKEIFPEIIAARLGCKSVSIKW